MNILGLAIQTFRPGNAAIHISTGQRMSILLAWRLGEMDPARVYRESYVWTFSAPGDQSERFREATTLLAQFAKATSSESYDIYLLKGGEGRMAP